jgi:hypothetical protein
MSTPAPPPLPAPAVAAAPRRRGRWFWPLQVVPPLLLLIFMGTDNGPGFYMGALVLLLVFGLPCLLSVVLRIGFLLFRRGDPRRLLRPLLGLGIVAGALVYTQASLREARVVAADEAARIQAECARAGACPDALTIGRGDHGRQRYVGTPSTHLQWPLRYHPAETGFELELLELMEASERWAGGPDAELVHVRVVEGGSSELFDD